MLVSNILELRKQQLGSLLARPGLLDEEGDQGEERAQEDPGEDNSGRSAGEGLCQEVIRATEGRARILLPGQDPSTDQPVPFPIAVSFLLQFRNRTYGRLDIAPDETHPASPALPLHVAQLLANTCGSLLYTLEMTVFIEGQCQRLDSQVPVRLTKREQEILERICQGDDQQAIATQLHIAPATVQTHRKRICEKLGVHTERDIPLAAYRANLFSILEKPTTDRSPVHS